MMAAPSTLRAPCSTKARTLRLLQLLHGLCAAGLWQLLLKRALKTMLQATVVNPQHAVAGSDTDPLWCRFKLAT